MAPAVMSSVQNMQEILFAQRLADNDKKIRDRSLKKLRKYLSVKSSNGPGFTEDDMIKIWKGLFYCMYMSDKPLVQEDLSENISGLISEFGNNADRRCFFKAAMGTFAREWQGLDVFRYDKFMMLVRKVLRYTFTHLLEQDWTLNEVTAIAAILENVVLCPDDNLNKKPMGLKLHVCDVFLEELAKIGGEALESDVIVALLQPFMKVLAISGLETLTKKVSSDIIRYLMRQSDAGIEAEEGDNMEIEDDEQDENEPDENEEDANEDVEAESQEDEGTLLDNGLTIASTGPLDPRAGGVDVCLPQLRPNWETLADALQALGSISGVKQKNRDNMYKLVGELRDISAGMYPLDVPEDNEDSDIEVPQEEMEKALDRLQKREEKLEEKILKGKKWKKNKNKETANEDELDNDEEPEKPFVSESLKIERKRKKNKRKKKFKPDAHTGVKKHKPNTVEDDAQLMEEVSARLTSIIPEVEMESTEFNEVTKTEIQKTKKKKNRKRKRDNGFEVTNINIANKEDSGDAANIAESITENPITSEESNASMLDTEFKPKKKKKKKDMKILDINETENETKKEKNKKNLEMSNKRENVENNSKKGKKKKNISRECLNEEKLKVNKEISPVVDSISEIKEKKKKKKAFTIEETENQNPNVSSTSESNIEKIKKKKKKKKSESKSTDITTTNVNEPLNDSTTNSLFEMIRKKKEEFKIDTDKKSETNDVGSENIAKKDLVLNFASSKKASQADPWDEPLKEGEVEVFIKSRKQIAKEKKKKKKVISSPLKKSPAGKRAIKINLKANQEHTFKEYERDVKKASTLPLPLPAFPSSPGILKPSPSPILIRKKSKLKMLDKISASASPKLKTKKFRMKAADFFT